MTHDIAAVAVEAQERLQRSRIVELHQRGSRPFGLRRKAHEQVVRQIALLDVALHDGHVVVRHVAVAQHEALAVQPVGKRTQQPGVNRRSKIDRAARTRDEMAHESFGPCLMAQAVGQCWHVDAKLTAKRLHIRGQGKKRKRNDHLIHVDTTPALQNDFRNELGIAVSDEDGTVGHTCQLVVGVLQKCRRVAPAFEIATPHAAGAVGASLHPIMAQIGIEGLDVAGLQSDTTLHVGPCLGGMKLAAIAAKVERPRAGNFPLHAFQHVSRAGIVLARQHVAIAHGLEQVAPGFFVVRPAPRFALPSPGLDGIPRRVAFGHDDAAHGFGRLRPCGQRRYTRQQQERQRKSFDKQRCSFHDEHCFEFVVCELSAIAIASAYTQTAEKFAPRRKKGGRRAKLPVLPMSTRPAATPFSQKAPRKKARAARQAPTTHCSSSIVHYPLLISSPGCALFGKLLKRTATLSFKIEKFLCVHPGERPLHPMDFDFHPMG